MVHTETVKFDLPDFIQLFKQLIFTALILGGVGAIAVALGPSAFGLELLDGQRFITAVVGMFMLLIAWAAIGDPILRLYRLASKDYDKSSRKYSDTISNAYDAFQRIPVVGLFSFWKALPAFEKLYVQSRIASVHEHLNKARNAARNSWFDNAAIDFDRAANLVSELKLREEYRDFISEAQLESLQNTVRKTLVESILPRIEQAVKESYMDALRKRNEVLQTAEEGRSLLAEQIIDETSATITAEEKRFDNLKNLQDHWDANLPSNQANLLRRIVSPNEGE